MRHNPYKILIVDDEPILRKSLSLHLIKEGYDVEQAGTVIKAQEALGLLQKNSMVTHGIDLVLCDWKLGDESGLHLIEKLCKFSVHESLKLDAPNVIFMSAHASHQIALEAIRLGADDYIAKPFEMSELLFRVKRSLDGRRLKKRVVELEQSSVGDKEDRLEEMIGRSSVMKQVFSVIRRVAPSQTKLLVLGESGTGKELIARAAHRLSLHPNGPFIAVNCGAIPESLIESELFGHIKGAFTHAQADRIGLIEEASGGTLFLDEIGELRLGLQTKLLRLLQEGEVRRVGSNYPIKVEVRVIAATLKNLEEEVQAHRFRSDLYYRLNVIPIQVPPLRDRLEDLPLLLDHFMRRMSLQMKRPKPRLSREVLKVLMSYDWPGNVRELENCVEHALTLAEHTTIELFDLPQRILHKSSQKKSNDLFSTEEMSLYGEQIDLSIKKHTQELEIRLITEALKRTRGIKTQAAKSLEISTKTLLYKLRDYEIDESQFSQ